MDWQKILDRVKSLTRAETQNFIDAVVVQPGTASAQRVVPASETPFWLPGHFKVFISHLSVDKLRATNLRGALKLLAISCFVAHEDIEPAKEWQVEIEKALFSMDALVAILTEKFHESKWTDQEVGVALGRGIVVLPIRSGLDPYGLMGKFQGVPSVGRSVKDVADLVVATLLKNPKARVRFIQCLVEQLLSSAEVSQATPKIGALELAGDIPADQLARLHDGGSSNAALFGDSATRERINTLLIKRGISPMQAQSVAEARLNDDIPF
jgi:TIR domain